MIYVYLILFMTPMILALSGCYRIPQIKSPVRTPQAFSKKGTDVLPSHWWKALKHPQLNQLISKALKDNFNIRAAWARLKQNQALARRSGATLYPSLQVGSNNSVGINERGFVGRTQQELAASYEIDLWGRLRATRRAADWDALASLQTLQATAISLSAEVATAWVQWSEQRGQLALIDQQRSLNQKTLSLLTTRFRLGQSTAADLLQQRQLLASQVGEREQVLSQIKQLQHRMAVLVGRPPATQHMTQGTRWTQLPPLPSTGLPSRLLKRRPDIQSAFSRIQAAHQRVAVAVASQFPQLTLNGSGSGTAQTFTNLLGSWVASLAANIVAPLFDGGRRAADIKRTKAVAQEALELYGQTILRALQEVEDSIVREQHLKRLQTSLRKQLQLAVQIRKQLRFRYAQGTESFLRVLDAERNHQALQRRYLTSQRDVWLARIALCRALSGSWKQTHTHTKLTPNQRQTKTK
jgi:NodT family efflux transporter outer membrane factor (OMF) lipoprotein